MWWQLLALQVGFFIILLFALKKLFHGHLLSAIERMEKMQQQIRRKEEEVRKYQETLKKDSEKKAQIFEEQLREKRAQAEEEVNQFKKSAKEMIEEEKRILSIEIKEKEKMIERRLEQQSNEKASRKAMGMILDSFSRKLLMVLHKELTEELLESLASVEKINLNGKGVKVLTAFPLTDTQKDALKKRLSKVSPTVTLVEEVDPLLVAGFVLFLDQQVLDGSLKNKLEGNVKS
jgi:F0F1-type ATP synthase delta subunit